MPVMLIAFDNQHRTVAWNRECERVTAYLAKEMIGKSDASLLLSGGKRESIRHDGSPLGDRSVEARTITCKDGSERRIAIFEMAQDLPLTGWAQCLVGVELSHQEAGQA